MNEPHRGLLLSPTLALVGGTHPDPVDRLAHALRQGSRAAMAEVFRAHLDSIYNYCYRRTGSWSAAEDLTSTVFLEAWRARRRVMPAGDGSVLPWLYGVAANVCRNHHRSQRRGAHALSRLPIPDLTTHDDDVVERLETDRRAALALSELRRLPARDQDVFILVCWEELSYADAALALDIPVGTVRSRLARVRRTLRLSDQPTIDDHLGGLR